MVQLILGVGFIGSALASHILDMGGTVVGFDDLSSSDERAIRRLEQNGRFQFVSGDICSAIDVANLFAHGPFERVYFLAGQSSANDAEISVLRTETVNLLGPRIVFDACEKFLVESIVLGSSLRVYGQPLPRTFDESTGYGIQRDMSHLSKIYTEKLLEMYAQRWPVRAVSARLAIVYGLSPVMKQDPSFMTVLNRFAMQACLGDPLHVSSHAGEISLLHVADAARALIECGNLRLSGYTPVNVLGEWVSLATLAQMVVDEGRMHGVVVEASIPPYRPQFVPDGQSRLDAMDFKRQRGLGDGLRELFEYFLANNNVAGS